jgi:hypothetical protein
MRKFPGLSTTERRRQGCMSILGGSMEPCRCGYAVERLSVVRQGNRAVCLLSDNGRPSAPPRVVARPRSERRGAASHRTRASRRGHNARRLLWKIEGGGQAIDKATQDDSRGE